MQPQLNILIPMAGRGSRFAEAGYEMPKPLIDVNGEYMISLVYRNLNLKGQYTFIVLKEHYNKYKLKLILEILSPGCNIVQVDSVTEGAACTALLAKQFIDNDSPLVIANSDQWVDWDSENFIKTVSRYDGGIVTFNSFGPKWSYARIVQGNIMEVAEKKQISNDATVGIYYFRHGNDFVSAAERMIKREVRTNGEFYICPVYNVLIEDGQWIAAYKADAMFGLGMPEDLNKYLNR